MKQIKIISIIIVLILTTLISSAQEQSLEAEVAKLANKMYQKREMENLPGAFMLAIKEGDVLYKRGYGYANFEHQVPISDQTIFDLASLAKMFTGYAIASLAEQGDIAMDDDVHKYLPELPDYGHKITIGHLVHHTSGIRNWTELLTLTGWSFDDSISFDQILNLIYTQKNLDFIPGSQYKYSNSGYNLLAKIIEQVSGMSFSEWTRKHIFIPLKMHDTFFNDIQNKIIPHLASGYYLDNNRERRRAFNNLTAVGSSSLFSNANDMQKWLTFLLKPPRHKKHIIKRMLTTGTLSNGAVNNYAYGIQVEQYRDTQFIGHSGSWASNTSYLLLLPEYDAGIFIIHNYRTYTRNKIEAYADIFLPKKVSVAPEKTPEKTITLTNNELDEFIGTYKLGIAWYVTISRKENKLYAQANGEQAHLMDPIAKQAFIVPAYSNRTITFLKNKQGEVDAFNYLNKRRQKQNKQRPKVVKLNQYQGIYHNSELGILFKIMVDGEGLTANHHKTGKIKLTNEFGDEFYGNGILRRIIFSRNKNEKVNGFYISNYRGKKQWLFTLAEIL